MTLPPGLQAVRERADQTVEIAMSPIFRTQAKRELALLDLIEEMAGALDGQIDIWELASPLIERGDDPLSVPFMAVHTPIERARAALDKYREWK